MAKQKTETKDNPVVETPQEPVVETPQEPVVETPQEPPVPPVEVETPPVPPVEISQKLEIAAAEIMKKHNIKEVFYVGGYFFTKKENAESALKNNPDSKLETFKQ
jgi:hypothetical protein